MIQVILLVVMAGPCSAQAIHNHPLIPEPHLLLLSLLAPAELTGEATPGISPDQASHAFFCQKERHLEKWLGVPIRFRLGDQATVDRLEQKKPPHSVQ